jgi:hypothetical protein
MQKGKIIIMRIVMIKKNITIKENFVNTKEENIPRRIVFTLERTISHLKKVMDMFLILKKNDSSS